MATMKKCVNGGSHDWKGQPKYANRSAPKPEAVCNACGRTQRELHRTKLVSGGIPSSCLEGGEHNWDGQPRNPSGLPKPEAACNACGGRYGRQVANKTRKFGVPCVNGGRHDWKGQPKYRGRTPRAEAVCNVCGKGWAELYNLPHRRGSCLEGGEHDWKGQPKTPSGYLQRRAVCNVCGRSKSEIDAEYYNPPISCLEGGDHDWKGQPKTEHGTPAPEAICNVCGWAAQAGHSEKLLRCVERDGWECHWCGRPFVSFQDLVERGECDHWLNKEHYQEENGTLYGYNDLPNRRALCRACNGTSGKGKLHPVKDKDEIDARLRKYNDWLEGQGHRRPSSDEGKK